MRDRLAHALRVLLVAAALVGYGLALRYQPAAGQDVEPGPATVEALARICVAEAGWDVATGDCAAIVHLLRRRADRQGLSVRRMATLYSARHFDEDRTDARRWIAGLTLDGDEPAGWPAHIPWSRYVPSWRHTIEHVRGALAGDVADPCGGRADHWGMRLRSSIDWRRATAAGWTLLDCDGGERNAYWSTRGGAS